MKNYWLSWYWGPKQHGGFTLYWPWWISGSECHFDPAIEDRQTICAAVQAESESAAKRIISDAFDTPGQEFEWRFCEERPAEWTPFSGRFPRGNWMLWKELIA